MKLLNTIHLFDVLAFDWCIKRRCRRPMIVMSRWVSRSADGHLYGVLALFAVALEQWSLFQMLVLGFACERPIYFVLKNQLKRRRPPQAIPQFTSVIEPSDQFSFPSGHTSAAFFIAGILSVLIPFLMIPLFLWAGLVGVSRVILGVHFPTDIVAGALLGFSMSVLALSWATVVF